MRIRQRLPEKRSGPRLLGLQGEIPALRGAFAQAAVLGWIEKKHPPRKDLIERCEFMLLVVWKRRRQHEARYFMGVTKSPASNS